MRIVVTGGQGAVGSRVVRLLREAGHTATSASRRTGVDLSTGAGLDEALAGADAVVHTADTTNPRRYAAVTLGGTRHLAEAAARAPRPPHIVYISIVGVDRNPYAYYKAKYAAEQALAVSGVPSTVVRATQFHSLIAAMARWARVGPVVLSVKGMQAQPVDIEWVSRRLAEVATGPAPAGFARTADLAGPERFGVDEAARLVASHEGRALRRVVELPPVGATMRAFADGAVLPGPQAEIGGERFVEWLVRQPRRLTGR